MQEASRFLWGFGGHFHNNIQEAFNREFKYDIMSAYTTKTKEAALCCGF
jgi:hypothetical protein